MRRLLSEQLALRTMLTIFSVTVIFHLLIITGTIPFDIVWGGRLKTKPDMLRFETISITANLLMLAVVLVRMEIMKIRIPGLLLSIAFLLMAILFLLNTIGNLLSNSLLEKVIFTPITLLLSLCSLRLTLKPETAIPTH